MEKLRRTIVSWEVEAGGIPANSWAVVEDPRMLYIVASQIEKLLKTDYYTGEGPVFLAEWDGKKMWLTLPHVDGEPAVFYAVLAKMITCMADTLVQLTWGPQVAAKIEAQMVQAAAKAEQGRILVPTMKVDVRPS